ncbi:bile acid:sodium symporter [Candidatus Uhrbacteria bacterium]|nr:bile acid:sodium symporter [Candidatus Uhrbacteria bacterium]
MHHLFRFFFLLLESYIVIAMLALGAGILFPTQTALLSPWVTLLLQIIFFLSSLKIDVREVLRVIRDVQLLVVACVYMLIVLPIILYGLTMVIAPQLAIAFMLLAAMPAAMSAPLFVEIIGLTPSLALVLTTVTSLLAPFTVPFVVWLLLGATVQVDAMGMFLALLTVIIVPFVIAQVVRWLWPRGIHFTAFALKPVSIILLGLLITGVVAQQAAAITAGLTGALLPALVALFVFFIALHGVGYLLFFWKSESDRLTISVCLTYMNFTLAIYLAGRFFNTPDVVLPVVLSVIPWTLLLIPFQWVTRRWCPSCFIRR